MKKNIFPFLFILFISCSGGDTRFLIGSTPSSDKSTGSGQTANGPDHESLRIQHQFKTDSAIYKISFQPAEVLLKEEMKDEKYTKEKTSERLEELKRNQHFIVNIQTRKKLKEIPAYFLSDFSNDISLTSGYDSIHPSFYLPVMSGNLKGGFDIMMDFNTGGSVGNYQLVINNKKFNDKFKSDFNIKAINTYYGSKTQL
jgi:hypothetical protein